MKNLVISIVFIFISGLLVSQSKIGLDHRLTPVTKGEKAIYFLSYTASENGNYLIHLYYSDEHILMKGSSLDSLAQQLDGLSVWYYKNGNVQAEGEYKNGQKQGTWKRYNEDGSPKSDRHYSEVSMNNIVFNSALYMPKPEVSSKNFEAFIKEKIIEQRQFDLIAYSPVAIQLIITNEGTVADRKYDDRLSMDEMKTLDNIINEIPSWKAGSNGTQNINVRVNYSIDLTID